MVATDVAAAPATELRLSARTVLLLRVLFAAVFIVSVALIALGVAAQVASYSQSFNTQLDEWSLNPTFWGDLAARLNEAAKVAVSGPQFSVDLAFSLVNLGLAGFLFWLRPRDVAGPLLAFALVGTAAVCSLGAHTVYEAADELALWEQVSHDGFTVLTAILYAFAVVVFPDGRLVPEWSAARRTVLYAAVVAGLAALALFTRDAGRSVVLVLVFGLGVPFAGLAAQAYRYRHPATDIHRQLSRLLVIALSVAALIGVFAVARGLQNTEEVFVGRGIQTVPLIPYRVFQVALSIVPLALFAGIFRYRLFSVDTLVTRTLVYGALAGFVSAVYISVVVGVGGVLGRGTDNLALSVAATFIVAVAFEPAKGRMERLANRIIYGHRATPYEVLSEFSERVADTVASEELLARMAKVLGEGTGAVRADVWLAIDDELRPAVQWPPGAQDGLRPLKITGPQIPWIDGVANAVAVRHQGELFGALSVVKKNATETLTPTEEKLMADLGRQAGLVMKNLRLTEDLRARLEDLRASRQRIVAAGDEERRRLERNLHDGAQQELVAIKVQLSLAEDMADELEGDNDALLELLAKLKGQTGDAVEALRDLARGIYPPLLAAEGLRVALSAQARKSPLDIDVDADVARYPQDIEAAVYFCCLEAFQNAAKYAGDCSVAVTIGEVDGGLRFEVKDSGCGFDTSSYEAGMGSRNMADRLEALDGWLRVSSAPGEGTTVAGFVPLPTP